MKITADVCFLVPPASIYPVNYFHQDEHEHHLDRLDLPAHSDAYMQFRFDIKTSFKQHSFMCIFKGNGKKPEIINWHSIFVKDGVKEKFPGKPESHFIDWHGGYHINEIKQQTADIVWVMGFNIQTHDPGDYTVTCHILGEDGSAEWSLPVRVK